MVKCPQFAFLCKLGWMKSRQLLENRRGIRRILEVDIILIKTIRDTPISRKNSRKIKLKKI